MVNPVWKVIEILFLFSVVTSRAIWRLCGLTDYKQVSKFKKVLAVVVVVVGIAAFILGSMTVLSWQLPA